MAIHNRDHIGGWRRSAFTLAVVAQTINAIPPRPPVVLHLDSGGSRGRQPAVDPPTGGERQPDSFVDGGPGPGIWDRFIARYAKRRPASETVRDANARLDTAISRYNRVRTIQGRPHVNRADLGLDDVTRELMGRPHE